MIHLLSVVALKSNEMRLIGQECLGLKTGVRARNSNV